MITRRALRRTKLLRSDVELNNLYVYCLAVLSERFGVAVHAFTVMSNHHHLVVTDTRGCMPDFLRELHRTIARAAKALRKWDGAFWDTDKPSVVELRTEQALIESLAYCMANPVAAKAVPRARQWPGLIVLPQHLGRRTCTAKRPDFYFDADNPQWPAVTKLRLTMASARMSDAQVRELVALELARLETEVHQEMSANGWRFLGPARVLAASPYDRATSSEPLYGRNPTFAVGRGQREAFRAAVTVLREFRKAYREALNAWRNGFRNALFPPGTWLMRCLHAAAVAPS